jgi:putative CocE/NonD family hydrolase
MMALQSAYERYSDITVEYDVIAQMRDGTLLYADLYRPTRGGPFPVLLMRLPYNKAQAEDLTYHHPAWYARQGFLVVVQDTRGCFRSEGDFYPFAHEASDGVDTVEWAASLPHANGRVAMYGFSYVGATQLLAATQRPPSLRTICPGLTASQYYDGWTYNQGAFALAFAASWATNLAMNTARKIGDEAKLAQLAAAFAQAPAWYGSLPLKTYPPLASFGLAPYFFDWLSHPSYDEYWKQWSIDADYSRITVPALHIGGWYDVFISGTVRNFVGLRHEAGTESARVQQKLLVGPWYHLPWGQVTGCVDFGPEARNIVDLWQLRWLRQFLFDEDTGVLEKPVTVFVMGLNEWQEFDAWPPSGAEMRAFYLHSAGAANSVNGNGRLTLDPPGAEPPDVYTYDPLFPVPSAGGRSCCFPAIAPMGPADQGAVEGLNGVLVYTSAPLERDLLVVGPVQLELYAASSAPDTDFTAKLCDVSPTGQSINVAQGIVRARYRESLSAPQLLTPGEVTRYRIDLGPTAHAFRRGHCIRLQVSSSDFPHWDRNLNTGGPFAEEGLSAARVATQLVLHQDGFASRLLLSVLPV